MKNSKNSNCYLCKESIDKNTIGLNKKLLGRSIVRFYCLSCLADYLDTTVEDLNVKIEDFKGQGCVLFS